MFQTGYLTIKSYNPFTQAYRLGIPNKEVEEGLFKGLLAANIGNDTPGLFSTLLKIRSAIFQGQVDDFLDRIRSFMAAIPYSLSQDKPEIYFENNLYLLFMLIGIHTHAEWQTSRERIDMLLETPDYIYVMELKLDGTPEQALAQIDSRDYANQFRHDGRKIIKIGLNFSSQSRNIDSWIVSQDI